MRSKSSEYPQLKVFEKSGLKLETNQEDEVVHVAF